MSDILTHRSSSLSLLVLFLISAAPLLVSSTRCHRNDRAALLGFKAAFPPGAAAFATWNTSVSCCEWLGISCDHKAPYRVLDFSVMSQDSVRGTIPAALGDLEFVNQILLYDLPNLVGPIPRHLTNLKHLLYLTITRTNLSGPIPSFMGELTALEELKLPQNNLSGRIPGSMLQNKIAVYLDLSNNHLSGPIPPAFARVDFRDINLSGNRLTGDASVLFGRSKLVSHIDLSMNQLDFDLTKVVLPEAGLTEILLNNNRIRGSIPPHIAEDVNLLFFNVSYNQLCGRIPTGGNMGRFDASSYSHNKCLCGTPLPPCK